MLTAYPSIGYEKDKLSELKKQNKINLKYLYDSYDLLCWPHAKSGFFKFKNKKDYTRKAKRSDFSAKHGISERTLSLAFKQVNLALSRIRTRRLGPHQLYFLSGTRVKRKSDGTPVSLTTALTESGYGSVIGDIIQKGRGLGLRRMGFWVFAFSPFETTHRWNARYKWSASPTVYWGGGGYNQQWMHHVITI